MTKLETYKKHRMEWITNAVQQVLDAYGKPLPERDNVKKIMEEMINEYQMPGSYEDYARKLLHMILLLLHREGPQKIRGLFWKNLPILRRKLSEAELIPTIDEDIISSLTLLKIPLDLHQNLIPKVRKIYHYARKTRNGLLTAIFLAHQTLEGENERFILSQTKFTHIAGLTDVTLRNNIQYVESHFQKDTNSEVCESLNGLDTK